MKRAVILARASGSKQVIEGDTLDHQIIHCENYIKDQGWEKVKTFPLVESGRIAEREYFNEVLEYCQNPKNKIDYIVFKNISRFTRKGDQDYLNWKVTLEKSGVELRDIYGTIRPKINTMAPHGFEYDWSVYSPSQTEETYQANEARDAVRNALTTMIGAEIDYTQAGYWNRTAPYGYLNQKIETTKEGKRNILVENSKEAFFIRKMFERRVEGVLTDKQIVKELNSLGFRTRKYCKRDKRTKKVIGHKGNNPLTPKHLQQFVRRPIYAGVICEVWTHSQPVKAKFEGLVSIDTFNQANTGKVKIVKSDDKLQIKYGTDLASELVVKRKNKNNPLYPFKNVLRCPICKNMLRGSGSRGKLGKHYPAYHCANGHSYWRKPRKEVHETVYKFIHQLKFTKTFTRLFEEVFLETWKEKRQEAVSDSQKSEEFVSSLLEEQNLIYENIKTSKSPAVKKKLEADYESLEQKIKEARENRGTKERKEIDIKLSVKSAVYFMEHLEELLIDEANSLRQQQLFGLVFEELPTYDELVNGTPNLSPIFALNAKPALSKSDLVTSLGLEPKLPG